jgi:hypothetical protein
VQVQADAHRQVGIPTIAGTVAASRLTDISPSALAFYFHIPSAGPDQEFVLSLTDGSTISAASDGAPIRLTATELVNLVDAQMPRTYAAWVSAIRDARLLGDEESPTGRGHWLFGAAQYKPIYLLIGEGGEDW